MEKVFELSCIYTSAAVSMILNEMPTYKVHNKRTLFCFHSSDALYKALNDFNNGIALNALEYSQMIRRLRAEMIMRRKMEENG